MISINGTRTKGKKIALTLCGALSIFYASCALAAVDERAHWPVETAVDWNSVYGKVNGVRLAEGDSVGMFDAEGNCYGAGLVKSLCPNPFFSTVRLSLSVADMHAPVTVDVYDITGRLIRRLATLDVSGDFRAEWDGRDSNGNRVASGTYFFAVTSRTGVQTRKVVLVR